MPKAYDHMRLWRIISHASACTILLLYHKAFRRAFTGVDELLSEDIAVRHYGFPLVFGWCILFWRFTDCLYIHEFDLRRAVFVGKRVCIVILGHTSWEYQAIDVITYRLDGCLPSYARLCTCADGDDERLSQNATRSLWCFSPLLRRRMKGKFYVLTYRICGWQQPIRKVRRVSSALERPEQVAAEL